MKYGALLRNAVCATVVTFALTHSAQATLRTFVSNNGNDANTATSCQPTAPCRTFAQAITVTDPSGEIVAMDASGYGPVTITKALSIIGVDGATVGAPAGGIGVTINAGTGNLVVIRIRSTVSNWAATPAFS
ncbi:MAG: hypothetical protein JOZ16_16520 [Methylobacteriaceae bacterium]|nr:hypothetical protein [Methylobacteriaceae bacterium]